MTNTRIDTLRGWLKGLEPSWQLDLATLAPASADASFRRYFRIESKNPTYPTLIVMDAPPQHEPLDAFIEIDLLLFEAGLHVPQILEQNIEDGFLLLSDLGHKTYLEALNNESANALYRDASHALVQMQLASKPNVLPNYDQALLQRELDLFPEWYLKQHLQLELSAIQTAQMRQAFALIIENNLAQEKVFVHRDFHSRNLMVTAQNNPGILDFQDAVYGPITYDAASLWRDAYIAWPEEMVIDWVIQFWEEGRKSGLPMPSDFGQFYRDFEWMGLQRHLKVLGIFARLFHRDGKDGYLKDIPLVLDYAIATANRYIELKPLARILEATRLKQND
ncbi:aminoglycoside phosphotransferase family protein [Polynucleobacter sphagniphilus]|jgi:aminoglycoside/choline kinase family phosphotransferase|uniref:Aminoglycoside/choline kinase family phosphotransferase n=1 Tax=Polynucleobacter sphagniphilus TaxID=1743169 RepID=A0AA43M869_9BURK|nr:phosphotransferase [Polynucleobacter sphagniphilus]MDF9788625.1 aminoglycoside/choline kinase family phosphotransferase [Polynucleobacter sphagniphilus]MDH6155204.1 aminoglycoside/choline kinase family phosphotransferase [Polynucleobacter sphagniphilus]MDH6250158.1 aminoglycoside/choline kinase family phosphotransferase [Polynucleobacter sphagniphilus]MDH6299716.1 aminoglycoside/choline kinase family phosphotransferase [Polynucleobacter sphagniphilus]MDH6502908.1 aminoglycoside/choline kina